MMLGINAGDYAAEIVFFLFKVAESLLEPSLGLYVYQCVCLQHDTTETEDPGLACSNLSSFPDLEKQVDLY